MTIIDDTATYTNAAIGKAMTHSVPVYTPARVAKVDIPATTILGVVLGVGPRYSVLDLVEVIIFQRLHVIVQHRGSGRILAMSFHISFIPTARGLDED